MELFGFQFGKKQKAEEKLLPSPVRPDLNDGAYEVAPTGIFGTYLDMDGVNGSDESQIIQKYRDLANQSTTDMAIGEIVDEAIVYDEHDSSVSLNTDKVKLPNTIKKKLADEFDNVLKLLKFNVEGSDIFRQWYIDGRRYYQIICDEKNPAAGIKELRYIDSLDIKKVKEVKKSKDKTGVEVVTGVEEFYIYNPNFSKTKQGGNGTTNSNSKIGKSIRLTSDSVIQINSGLVDQSSGKILSYLHKAIRPANQLRMMEDAVVIYRISRAPERRVFNVFTGNLQPSKAEEYLNKVIGKHRNKTVYDASTGEIRGEKKFVSMMEDYFFPKGSSGEGTTVDTLPGGQNLSQIEDVDYFAQKLFTSLNVPIGRLVPSTNGFSIGKPEQITRDEVRFSKFINKLRKRFNKVFYDALKVQCILKGIISPEDWDEIAEDIFIDYNKDNYFSELKEQEILKERLSVLQLADSFVGRYFSTEGLRKEVLKQSEEDIETINKEMKPDLEAMAFAQDQEDKEEAAEQNASK